MRRQGKGPLLKNLERYVQEEQVKNLSRLIKQKRIELAKKSQENATTRKKLLYEIGYQVNF